MKRLASSRWLPDSAVFVPLGRSTSPYAGGVGEEKRFPSSTLWLLSVVGPLIKHH